MAGEIITGRWARGVNARGDETGVWHAAAEYPPAPGGTLNRIGAACGESTRIGGQIEALPGGVHRCQRIGCVNAWERERAAAVLASAARAAAGAGEQGPNPTRAHIGDVLVHRGEPADGNPYHGQSMCGPARAAALRAFRDGDAKACEPYTFWHAPASGGARRITAAEVDWESSGIGGRS
jgi:hypothetical protein